MSSAEDLILTKTYLYLLGTIFSLVFEELCSCTTPEHMSCHVGISE